MSNIPQLGIGIVYHSGIDEIIENNIDLIDIIELEPQTIWYKGSIRDNDFKYDTAIVERLKSFSKPLIFHGVGFPVGGTIPPDPIQIPLLKELMNELKPYWMSEHLSFNTVVDREDKIFNTNLLLPPRQTKNGIFYAVRSISSMKNDIEIPFAFETGVNYLKPFPDELPDGEFIKQIAEDADCFILLDLHNIYTNELNGRQSAEKFLDQIPLERVIEIHIAGGFFHKGYYLDAHSGLSSDALLELTEETVCRCPNLKALIFEMLPEYSTTISMNEIRQQFNTMRKIWQKRRIELEKSFKDMTFSSNKTGEVINDSKEWEFALGHLVVGRDPGNKLSEILISDPGIQIFRELLYHFRASIIVTTLKLSTRLLRLSLGEIIFENLIKKFMDEYYPEDFPFVVAEQFSQFIRNQSLDVKYLNDILIYEETTIKVTSDKIPRTVHFNYNPLPLLKALSMTKLPAEALDGFNVEIEITPDEQVKNQDEMFTLHSVLHN